MVYILTMDFFIDSFLIYIIKTVCSNLLYSLLLLLSQASCPYAQKDTLLGQQRKRKKR